MKYILLFLLSITTLFSQSIIVTDINTDNYPNVGFDFFVTDDNGNDINYDVNKISLEENGINKSLKFIGCNKEYTKEPISLVLTIDISSSMNDTITAPSTKRIDVVKEAAKRIINRFHPDSEIAFTIFSAEPTILQSLTTDRTLIENEIDNLDIPLGATDISKAFLDEDEGVITAFDNAKYKKVSLFMTDGIDGALEKDSISKLLNEGDITLYSLSAGSYLEQELIDVTLQSGGSIFNGAQSEEEIYNAFSAITNYILNITPCSAIYTSDICSLSRYLNLSYNNEYAGSKSFSMIKNQLIEYRIINNSQKKYGDENYLFYVTIQSNKDDLTITDITSNYKEFSLLEPENSSFPITLNEDETLNLTFTNSVKEGNIYDFFNIESSSCFDDKIYLKFSNNVNSLNIVTPNGGEEFYIGTNENLYWTDGEESNNYNVSYSTNSGANWLNIVNDYSDTDFPWNTIPEPETDNALLKVNKKISLDSRLKTTSVETLDKPFTSKFESIIPYMDDKFLAISDMYLNFKFSNLNLTNTDLDVIPEFDLNFIKILMILDKDLKVLDYVPISTSTKFLNLAAVGSTPYLSMNNVENVVVDTMTFTTFSQSGSDYGIIIKFDEDLNYVKHNTYRVKDGFFNFNDYIIDFKSSQDGLHLLGQTGRYYEYNDSLIISLLGSSEVYFLTSLDLDLNFKDIEIYDVNSDNFDFEPLGIDPINNDSVTWWGNGTGKYFNLDSNHRAMTLISSYSNDNIVTSNFLSVEKSGKVLFTDFIRYRDQEYWLYSSEEILETKNGTKIEFAADHWVNLLNFDSNGEVSWLVGFDDYGINKKLSIFNNEDILAAGRMNKAVRIDGEIVSERGNTTFFTGIDLFSGKLSWYRYGRTANTFITATSNDNTIVFSGKLNDETDFGNGFVKGSSTVDTLDNHFLWALDVNTEPIYDISDSLWSIKSPGFEYIDTVDFGNVYSGSIKDTLVLDFFKVTDESINIIIENINIEDPGYYLDFITPYTLDTNTDLKIILDVNMAGNGLAKGVISTNVGDFNFYVNSNEVELKYRPFYANDSLAIDFGAVLVGEQKSETINILENLGLANIGIDSVKIVNDNSSNYDYNIISSGTLIVSGDTLITEFTFSPIFVGTLNATAQFYTDLNREPFLINMTGKGISNDTVRINIKVDSLVNDADRYVDLNTFITLNDNPTSLQFDSLEIDIEYNATLLIPFRLPDEGIVENKIRKITIPISKTEIQDGIDTKRFYSTIGNSISTDILISAVRAYNVNDELINELKYTTENGYFKLTNVCYSEGSYRLYSESDPTDLNIYYENGEYFVNYNLIEDGFTNISVYNTTGELVNHLVNKKMNKGAYSTEVNTRNIANGSYIVQLETENVVLSKMLVIVK